MIAMGIWRWIVLTPKRKRSPRYWPTICREVGLWCAALPEGGMVKAFIESCNSVLKYLLLELTVPPDFDMI